MAIDVTDATFQTEVIDKSAEAVVVIDLGHRGAARAARSARSSEAAVAATDGKVVMAKVNVDENPGISQAFQVQSIPAVYAMKGGQIVDGFLGAQPEHVVTGVDQPPAAHRAGGSAECPAAAGDEASLRNAAARPRQRAGDRRARRTARRRRCQRRGAGAARAHPRVRSHPARSPPQRAWVSS